MGVGVVAIITGFRDMEGIGVGDNRGVGDSLTITIGVGVIIGVNTGVDEIIATVPVVPEPEPNNPSNPSMSIPIYGLLAFSRASFSLTLSPSRINKSKTPAPCCTAFTDSRDQ